MFEEILFRFRFMKILRQRYYTFFVKIFCQQYTAPLRVNHKSKVTKKTTLGKNVNFNGMTIKGSGLVTIGDNFHSGEACKIITQVHNYEGNSIPYDSNYLLKDVVIEDNVWIGDSVIILGGVTIGEGAIIQAGSVVVKSIDKYQIAGGHPCKPFKTRNIEHYKKLKSEKKFH
jgi:acetyltransferase-like isoleucine patch superfamily enzyme